MSLPAGFVYLHEVDASIIQDIKYATSDNFIGRPIAGYQSATCILTEATAAALAQLQKKLLLQGLCLNMFDGYRPQQAVNDFIAWSQDASDQKMKAEYYPRINKADFFKLGLLSEQSGHTRGSTVDLTIMQLDMGTPFDFMDARSHVFSEDMNSEVRANRLFLREQMQLVGFIPYDMEWWHFTLENEPFPNTYFDFVIT